MAIGEIILHVGMHKTGTTSIQQTFDGYDDGNVAFADLKIPGNMTPNHGVAIETIFRKAIDQIPHHQRMDHDEHLIVSYRKQFRAKLRAALALDRTRLIISGEAIPRLHGKGLRRLRRKLQRAAEKVTVLVYVREPLGFASSMFQQRCRLSMFRGPGALPTPQYRRKFNKFIKVFGRANVQFVHYDRASLIGGSSVEDFASRVGIRDIPDVRLANVGLSADATRCVYILGTSGRIDFDRLEARIALTRMLTPLGIGMPGPSFRLPAASVAKRVNPDDVRWINQTTGFDIALPPVNADDTTDMDVALRQVSPKGIQQLRTILTEAGRTPPIDATIDAMMQSLFALHFKERGARATLRRALARLRAKVGARIAPK